MDRPGSRSFERDALRPFRSMPRPQGRGLLGNVPDWTGTEAALGVLQRLLGYANTLGPICRVPLGPASIVAVNDGELAAQLLSSEEANHKGWSYTVTRVVLDIVVLLNADAWEHDRRVYRSALRGIDVMASANSTLDRYVAQDNEGPVDLAHEARSLVGGTVGDFITGAKIPSEVAPHQARVQNELAAIGMDLQCQPWAYFSPKRWIALRDSVQRLRAHFRGRVKLRRADGTQRSDVLGRLLEMAKTGEVQDDDARLADLLVGIFFTAHDVLATSLGWCLWLLAANPDVQTRLRPQLRELPDGPLSAADLEGVRYLDQVIKESLRLHPGYSLFARTPHRPIALGGYRIPKNTTCMLSPWVIHRQERRWPDPERFDPERWPAADGSALPRPETGYLPFGAGHRGCLASHLAYPLMKILVARTLREFELRAKPGHSPRLRYWGTAFSENGLLAELRRGC